MQKKRLITVTIILVVALAGLMMINTERATADRMFDQSSTAAVDQSNAPGAASATDMTGSLLPTMAKMVSALVLVIAGIYFGIYGLKKLSTRGSARAGKSGNLELLETTYVAPKRTISLVRVGERSVLIGVTDQNISVLSELDKDETAELLKSEPTELTQPGFASVLNSATKKIKEFGLKRNRAVLEA